LNNVGVASNQFGFDLNGNSNQVAVVEASTNFFDWAPLSTNNLGNTGLLHFSDPVAPAFPQRFYRARGQ